MHINAGLVLAKMNKLSAQGIKNAQHPGTALIMKLLPGVKRPMYCKHNDYVPK
jgi:hypothetical protein